MGVESTRVHGRPGSDDAVAIAVVIRSRLVRAAFFGTAIAENSLENVPEPPASDAIDDAIDGGVESEQHIGKGGGVRVGQRREPAVQPVEVAHADGEAQQKVGRLTHDEHGHDGHEDERERVHLGAAAALRTSERSALTRQPRPVQLGRLQRGNELEIENGEDEQRHYKPKDEERRCLVDYVVVLVASQGCGYCEDPEAAHAVVWLLLCGLFEEAGYVVDGSQEREKEYGDSRLV